MPVLAYTGCGTKTVEIDYLGQNPPGMTAELFAPHLLGTSANEHSAIAFSPDGSVVLWAVMDSRYRGRFFEMKHEKGAWSKPASPVFAYTTSDDYNPSFSPNAKRYSSVHGEKHLQAMRKARETGSGLSQEWQRAGEFLSLSTRPFRGRGSLDTL